MKRCFFILLFIFVMLLFTACSPYSNEHVDYIKENAIVIGLDSYQEINKYDNNFNNYDIYFIGENHANHETFAVELYFFKYLYTYHNVRDLYIEIGYATSQLVNLYFETGNVGYLQIIMNNLKGTFSYSKEYYDFFVSLYEFQNKNELIKLHGIDIEHQFSTGIYYLSLLITDTEIPNVIKEDIDNLKNYQSGYTVDDFNNLYDGIKENETDYQIYLKDSYSDFKRAIINIRQGFDSYNGKIYDNNLYSENDGNDFASIRENYMYYNFIETYEAGKKVLGIFGGAHTDFNGYVYTANKQAAKCIANQLNYNLEYKGKMASIGIEYYDSYYLDRTTGKGKKMEVTQYSVLLGRNLENYSFIRLDMEDSPFINYNNTLSSQYSFLIKGGKEATKYE